MKSSDVVTARAMYRTPSSMLSTAQWHISEPLPEQCFLLCHAVLHRIEREKAVTHTLQASRNNGWSAVREVRGLKSTRKPCTTKDAPCRAAMHVKSAHPPVGVLWLLGEVVPAHVVHGPWFKITWSVAKSPRVAEQR
ncbi:hypothetical protein TNCV_85771 [Trichonephila clavipes]|nr:hypothetical protein TNCV_85771 [Trichonephila clavipes]